MYDVWLPVEVSTQRERERERERGEKHCMTYGCQWRFQHRERETQLGCPSDTSSETPPHSCRNNTTRNVCYNAMNAF